MNVQALISIGVLALLMAAVLGVVGWLFARWYGRRHPELPKHKFTPIGIIFLTIIVLALVIGTGWATFYPDSWPAKLREVSVMVLVIVIGAPFILVGLLLERLGVSFGSVEKEEAETSKSSPPGP